ncbi:MAG: hypothetical protein E7040_04550 [Lentisphaerae bacterium]|nr:hypothetical protein [Lentisphaerota bacterium]
MKKRLLLFSLFLTSGIFAQNAVEESRLFYLDFENGTTAAFAKGSPEGTFLAKGKKPEFVEGYKGKGFKTGNSHEALKYSALKNVNGQSGTITFWQKKLDHVEFNTNDKLHHIFFELNERGRNTLFYKYGYSFRPWILERYLFEKKNQTATVSLPGENTYDKKAWHQYAYVWDNQKASLYMDGICVGTVVKKAPAPATSNVGSITFGQSWGGWNKGNNRIMDEISIYGKALTPAEIYYLYQKERITPPKPEFTLAPAAGKVTTDGKMSAGEYDNATAFPLLFNSATGSVAEVPAVLYLTYDKDNLYFFLKSPLGKKAFELAHTALLDGMFLRQRGDHDQDIDNDDSLILDFLYNTMNYYMAVNTLDIKYDYTISAKKEIFLKWTPKWKTVSAVNENGWQVEGFIPLKDLGITPADGTVFEANFARNWKKLKLQTESLIQDPNSGKGGFRKEKFYGKFTLAGKNTVAVRIDDIEKFDCNGIKFKGFLQNAGQKVQDVRYQLKAGTKILWDQTTRIQPGKSVEISYYTKFPASVMNISFLVTSKDGKQVYFKLDNPVYSLDDIQLRIAPIPSKQMVSVSGSFPQLNINPDNTKAVVEIFKDKKSLWKIVIELSELAFQTELSLKGYAPGDYRVNVKLVENGITAAEKETVISHLPMPAWYGNKIGISDKVPSPWIPVKVKENTVSLLNSGYDFGKNPLPEKIFVEGENILAAPISVATDEGKLIMKNKVLSRKDTEAVIEGKGSLGGVDFVMNTTVEYDGFMWHKFTLKPHAKGVTVNKLQIVIPLKKEYGDLIVPYDYTLSTTGTLTKWNGTNRPLWVGSAEKGISFVAEHSHNWGLDHSNQALEAERTANNTVMKINLINTPTLLTGDETFEFSLQATPAKPVDPGYRDMRFCASKDLNTVFKDEENKDFLIWWAGGWGKVSQTCGDVCYPFVRENLTAGNYNKTFGKNNRISVLPYFQLHETWGDSKEFKQFGYEWICSSNMPVITVSDTRNNRMPVCQASRSFQDFDLWGLQQFVKQCNLRGFYFDMSQPRECTNTAHGCGYLKNGQVLPTTNYRGARQMVKRIYTMLREHRSDSFIIYHNSGQICAQVHGFAGAFIDGENFNSRLVKNRGYQEILRPDVFRAEYMGRNFGVIGAMLPEFRIDNDIRNYLNGKKHSPSAKAAYDELDAHQNYLFGLALLHDCQINTGWLYHKKNTYRSFAILRDMDYRKGKLTFVPYWKQTICKTDPKREIVSFYKDKGKAYAVVMNLENNKRDLTLEQLNLSALGLKTVKGLENLRHDEQVAIWINRLTIIGIPGKQYRVIKLSE